MNPLGKKPKTRKRCLICGYRIRGKNHENGEHHKRAVRKLKGYSV